MLRLTSLHELYFYLQVRMRFLYESKSVTSGAGFRSSLCTVLAATIYIRYTTIYCNIFFGKCKCTIINFTFASFPPSGTFPFNRSHIKHRRMPLQAHEAPPSVFSGSILAHLLRIGDESNVIEWRHLAIVQTTYLNLQNCPLRGVRSWFKPRPPDVRRYQTPGKLSLGFNSDREQATTIR